MSKVQVIEAPVRQRRLEKRIPCDPSPVRITPEYDFGTVEGSVVDVSKSGLRLRLPKNFRRGAKITAEMNGLVIIGSIRYCREHEKNRGFFDMGLRIDDPE